ncbi:MAG: acetyl-CoA carboxylase biotin carboxyl carrier protein subunit [Tannerellaceae bacterium]|nr:acetyl-CoA carboxylase biotin carboxyl carrier protein subunit [Tannerellaceae bacterium]
MENKEELVDFVVTARKYKTLLTTKYKNREVWQKPVEGEVRSNLPGTIIQLVVKENEQVQEGQLLLIHEAMKMLNRIVAPVSGTVKVINVKEGDKIGKNHLMIKIED